jgi:CubicO group peptidase (beta-lactamase class C family)
MIPRMRSRMRGVAAALLLAGLLGGLSLAAAPPVRASPQQAAGVYPATDWVRIADPAAAGYCQAGLDAATAKAKSMATTSATAVVGGRVLWDYGDQAFVSYLASVRKSLLAMMYGKYVAAGRIALNKSMKDLNITDVQGLLPREQEATVLDLLGARSGVYHPAANAASAAGGDTVGTPPDRGTVAPGTYFLYNNWDFNALGTIFEQETGQNIYDAFLADFATPMQLQDFRRDAQRKSVNAARSMHPAYHFYLSSRDMARLGLLMLREGNWAGKPLVPRDWVRRMITPVTRVSDMNPADYRNGPFGYGLLWWIWDGDANRGPYRGAYTGIGAVGQFLTILPELDMVVAHKTRQGQASVSRAEYLALVDALIGAKCR